MRITVHRGQDQIGGSVIEIASATTKIVLDAGAQLGETHPAAPPIPGLFEGKADVDALFLSHNHGDHMGLCPQVLPEIPVYAGAKAAAVANAACRYLKRPEYRFSGCYEAGRPVCIGDLRVTPYLCDHSAFDSYMLHVACGDRSLLYTGDFRSNGRKDFAALLRRLPGAEVLITEGTTLTRNAAVPQKEAELEQAAVVEMSRTDGPVFVLQAATNVDRLVTIMKAAHRCNRVLLEDLYMAEVATAAGGSIPNPLTFSGVRVFMADGREERYALLDGTYRKAKIGRTGIARQRFVMCVRPSMQGYLEGLSRQVPFENGLLLYSMWSGYKQKEEVADFLRFMQMKGVRIVDLHTSGHADAETLRLLVDTVKPKYVLPVHTENAGWFETFGSHSVIREKCFSW